MNIKQERHRKVQGKHQAIVKSRGRNEKGGSKFIIIQISGRDQHIGWHSPREIGVGKEKKGRAMAGGGLNRVDEGYTTKMRGLNHKGGGAIRSTRRLLKADGEQSIKKEDTRERKGKGKGYD